MVLRVVDLERMLRFHCKVLGARSSDDQLRAGRAPDVNAQNAEGCTALMYGAQNGHFATVQALIENGAHLKVKNEGGLTAK